MEDLLRTAHLATSPPYGDERDNYLLITVINFIDNSSGGSSLRDQRSDIPQYLEQNFIHRGRT